MMLKDVEQQKHCWYVYLETGTSDAIYPLRDTANGVPASPFFLNNGGNKMENIYALDSYDQITVLD